MGEACRYCGEVHERMGRQNCITALKKRLARLDEALQRIANELIWVNFVEPISLYADAAQAAEARTAALEAALRDAVDALGDLGACDNPECHEPNCNHALPRARALLAATEVRRG